MKKRKCCKEEKIEVADIQAEVIRKDIKHMYLSLKPPKGIVEIKAPLETPLSEIKGFLFAKKVWIEKHQNKIKKRTFEEDFSFSSGEKHFFLGKKLLLKIIPSRDHPKVTIRKNNINLHIDPSMPIRGRILVLDNFYKKEFQKRIPYLFEKWTKIMKVSVREVRVKKMKNMWGSCNVVDQRIALNLDLIKTPENCIEYVFVYHMLLFLASSSDPKFNTLMKKHLPDWQLREEKLRAFQFH